MWIEPMIESNCRKIIRFEKSELLCELDQTPTTEKGENLYVDWTSCRKIPTIWKMWIELNCRNIPTIWKVWKFYVDWIKL